MQHHYTLFLFAILATIALAAPTKRSFGLSVGFTMNNSFKVSRTRNTEYVRSPSKALTRAYRKFGWEMPSSLSDLISDFEGLVTGTSATASTSVSSSSTTVDLSGAKYASSSVVASASASATASTSNETGEVTATPADEGAEYLSEVSIGGQKVNLNFDTGSADLWVFSSYLPSSEIGSHSVFNPNKSSTYKNYTGASFNIAYGDGSGAEGFVGYDTVNIGGAVVKHQAVELATSVSSAFVSDTESDGLVGLAFSSINSVSPVAQNTFFANIMSSLEQPVFTVTLDQDGSGEYEFGTIDTSKYTGDLTFTTIDQSAGYWQFDSMSYSVGGNVTNRTSASAAIADTGTSLLLMDDEVVEAYYGQVTGAKNDDSIGGWVYSCSADLPDLEVAVGSYMAKLPGANMTYTSVSSSLCYGGLQSNSGSGLQIFGDMLLAQQFTVFHGEALLGMAAKA